MSSKMLEGRSLGQESFDFSGLDLRSDAPVISTVQKELQPVEPERGGR
jgi:hypothetical protein